MVIQNSTNTGRPSRSQLAQMAATIREISDRQSTAGSEDISHVEAQTLELEKWRLIHKLVHSTPFSTRGHLKRSQQWHACVAEVREIGEVEVLDWVLLQKEVAENLERGIQDLRPRKNGPCHTLLLEYVANRKRKALAVLHFAREGEKHGIYAVDSNWHTTTADILRRHGLLETDEDGNPVYSTDPMMRS